MVRTTQVGSLYKQVGWRLRGLQKSVYLPVACESGETRRSCVCCYRLLSRRGTRTRANKRVWPAVAAAEWTNTTFSLRLRSVADVLRNLAINRHSAH